MSTRDGIRGLAGVLTGWRKFCTAVPVRPGPAAAVCATGYLPVISLNRRRGMAGRVRRLAVWTKDGDQHDDVRQGVDSDGRCPRGSCSGCWKCGQTEGAEGGQGVERQTGGGGAGRVYRFTRLQAVVIRVGGKAHERVCIARHRHLARRLQEWIYFRFRRIARRRPNSG